MCILELPDCVTPCGTDLFHYDTPCDALSLCRNLLLINRLLTEIRFIPASRKPVAFLIVCLPAGRRIVRRCGRLFRDSDASSGIAWESKPCSRRVLVHFNLGAYIFPELRAVLHIAWRLICCRCRYYENCRSRWKSTRNMWRKIFDDKIKFKFFGFHAPLKTIDVSKGLIDYLKLVLL